METLIEWLKERDIHASNTELIRQAFIHTSYYNEHKTLKGDNERLEFMGDAVLQLWTTDALFKMQPPISEGKMTTLRSQLVREEALAEYTRTLGWNEYLLLGVGEEKSGGRNRDSLLGDMFEAILGAIYLDCGYDAVKTILDEVIRPHIKEPKSEKVTDYKTKLQEFIQADTRKTVRYDLIKSTGPSNAPIFEIAVKLDNVILGRGKGSSKKKAEQHAAKDALFKMVK